MGRKIRVGIIFGGRSAEHEVSLRSARSVMAAIDDTRYQTVPIGIDKEGRWLAAGTPAAGTPAAGTPAAGTPAAGTPAAGDPMQTLLEGADPKLLEGGGGAAGETLGLADGEPASVVPRERMLSRADVIFPVLHGPYGEDGTVQGLLELAGVAYVGAGVTASALAMDKVLFKDVMRAHGIPTIGSLAVKRRRWERAPEAVLDELEEGLDYPVFVKPANLGSSVGISKCQDRESLAAGLEEAARFDRKLLVELAVPNAREIEVSVLGNDDPEASVPGEIRASREFYDYASKYLDADADASELLIPAPLDAELTARIRELAVETYLAIDCSGLARVDFLLDDGSGEIYVNEVNTIPGFTSISMYSKLWEASGISYRELISRLVELALERHRDRQRSATSYEIAE